MEDREKLQLAETLQSGFDRDEQERAERQAYIERAQQSEK
jgi:hypothetical protein